MTKIRNNNGPSFFELFLKSVWPLQNIKWQMSLLEAVKMIRYSLFVVIISSLFIGAIMTIVFEAQLAEFRATHLMGTFTSSALIREVAPLLVAFILSGRCGAYAAGEISAMKATEQLNTLKSLGLSDMQLIVLPRLIGIFIASTFTLGLSLVGGMMGSLLFSNLSFGIHPVTFFMHFEWLISWETLGSGVYKSICFGAAIAYLSCLAGYRAQKTAQGVGNAVQKAAISNMLAIIILDTLTTHTYNAFITLFGLSGGPF